MCFVSSGKGGNKKETNACNLQTLKVLSAVKELTISADKVQNLLLSADTEAVSAVNGLS